MGDTGQMPQDPVEAFDDPIAILENSLRDLIGDVLKAKHGDEWANSLGIAQERIDQWKERREVEKRRRTGGIIDDRLLYYADFYDLKTLIRKHWDSGLSDCFGDLKSTELYLEKLDSLRNPDAHSRNWLPFERNLVEGMTGELRQKITLYRSKGGIKDEREYFARIDSARDNFGNSPQSTASGGSGAATTGLTLHVGDVLHFHLTAWDPENATLSWFCSDAFDGSMTGSTLDVSVALAEKHVAQDKMFFVYLEIPAPVFTHGYRQRRLCRVHLPNPTRLT